MISQWLDRWLAKERDRKSEKAGNEGQMRNWRQGKARWGLEKVNEAKLDQGIGKMALTHAKERYIKKWCEAVEWA